MPEDKRDQENTSLCHDHQKPTLRETVDIAIIGGGIIGVIMALGLAHRGMKVIIYERASKFTETGAGFAFTSGSREAMRIVNPKVLQAFLRVGAPSKDRFMRYFDGFTTGVDEPSWQFPADRPGYYGCLRAAFLEELGRELPEGVILFGKTLESYEDREGEKVVLQFTDGSIVEVDAVIGCDGIRSRTRQIMLGENNPAAYPSFANIVAYRALLPIESVVAAMGEDKGYSHCQHVGPGAYTVTYPVANSTLTNTIVFCKTSEAWPDSSKLLETCNRENAQKAVQHWKADIQAVVDLLPEKPNKWAIFDTADHPAASYTSGRVCIAGDAAHASTPFLASGAAMGVEGAAVLATLLDTALGRTEPASQAAKDGAIIAAFETFSNIRLRRSQRVVTDSRAVGDICLWQNPETGRDGGKCFADIWPRCCHAWEFDIGDVLERVRRECDGLLKGYHGNV